MAIAALQVSGYRSIRRIDLELEQVNVIVGPNGCGKTNLYRSMYLLSAAAGGQLARTLMEEGGMPSALWAGTRQKGAVRLTVGATIDRLSYTLSLGLPPPRCSVFTLDPQVKEEKVVFHEGRRNVNLLERGLTSVWAHDAEGKRITYPMALSDSESVLAQLREPHRFPHLSALRQEILGWRFYHHFRADADSPLRQPQVGIYTPVLSHNGHDLAAALQTIRESGDSQALDEGVDRAFPGARLLIHANEARFSAALHMPGFHRPFDARELSDGTLRYLCLLAALLSPRPPSVLALNEPETSIHPDLLKPLAQLIVHAARHSQLWITTHSEVLAAAITEDSGKPPIWLEKTDGETRLAGRGFDPSVDVDEEDQPFRVIRHRPRAPGPDEDEGEE